MIKFKPKIAGLQGQDNVSGIEQKVWLAEVGWFDVLQNTVRQLNDSLPDDRESAELLRITADHTFKAGKGFIELYTTMDTGQLALPPAPARDQSGSMASIQVFYPGNDLDAMGFLYVAQNFEWIVLVTAPNGKVFQLGRAGLTCSVRPSYNTNTLTGERAGMAVTIEAFMIRPIVYEGVITPYPTV